jgi:hypothetical protein
MTDTSREALERKMLNTEQPEQTPRKTIKKTADSEKQPSISAADEPDRIQDALLAVALLDVNVQDLFTGINPMIFRGSDRQTIATYLAEHKGKPIETVPESLQPQEKYVTMLLLHPDIESVDWNSDNRITTATDVLRLLQANYQKTNTKEDLLQQEAAARERGDDSAAEEYLRKLSIVIKGEK